LYFLLNFRPFSTTKFIKSWLFTLRANKFLHKIYLIYRYIEPIISRILNKHVIFMIAFNNECFNTYIFTYSMISMHDIITNVKFLIILNSFSICNIMLFSNLSFFLFK